MSTEVRAAVAANPLWYHTMDLAPGVITPGWFDLRPIVEQMPWPDVRAKRCLDVGTYDGFLAFELERRGAAEVVAVDIADHEDWDWPPRERALGADHLRRIAGEKGRGFEIARDALGSAVERRSVSVYDLTPDRVGMFDVVVCGDLLLHLRDPMRALEAIRGVCTEAFLSAEQVDLVLSLVHPRRATLQLNGDAAQWFIPNLAGHARMLHVAGFDLVRKARYAIPHGSAHPQSRPSVRSRSRGLLERAVVGACGLATSAVLCRPLPPG